MARLWLRNLLLCPCYLSLTIWKGAGYIWGCFVHYRVVRLLDLSVEECRTLECHLSKNTL